MKKKIKLKELRVQSFVTSLNQGERAALKGGAATNDGKVCELTVTIFDSSPQRCHTNTLCPTTP